MNRHAFLSATLTVLIGFCYSSLALAQVTISDGDFDPSNWQDTVYIQDPGTSIGAFTTEASGGNPGAHREMTFLWNTGGGTAAIYVFCKYTAASYNPSVRGAIATVNYSEDGRVTSESHGSATITLPARMALEQNGTIYSSRVVSTIQSPPFPGPWTNLTLDGLRASNFPKASGPGPDRPDFSESGSEIFFGYVRANSTGIAVQEIVTGIDNWTVTINQQADASYSINKVVLNDVGTEITSAQVGDNIAYRLTFTNTGGLDLTGTEVTDALPENLQYNGYAATPTNPGVIYDLGPPATVFWPVGTVATGGSASLDINMTILAGADQLVLTNVAEVTAIGAPAIAGQTTSVDLDVRPPEADLDFVLVMMEDLGDVGGGVYKTRVTSTVQNNGPDAAEGMVVIYDYAQMLNSPEAIVTGDPIGDLMICEDRPAQRQFYCEVPLPNTCDAGVTADLVVEYVRTGNPATPEVTMYATTYDPIPSNNNFTLPDAQPHDYSGGGGGSICFIQSLTLN